MISAKIARRMTEKKQLDAVRNEIEVSITKAIDKGRDKIVYTGVIPACIVSELEENGYIIVNNVIKW